MVHFKPGDRVIVFDPTLWEDDKRTPLSVTFKPATIIRCYAHRSKGAPIVADVIFDHDRRLSKAHFIAEIRRIEL